MANIWCLCPSDMAGYLHILEQTAPVLDRAGISFHVARPGEDLTHLILKSEGREPAVKGEEVTK